MNRFLLLLNAFLLPFCLSAQQEGVEYPITSKTIFKDANGEKISFEAFLESTSGQDYMIEPVFDEEENIREIYIIEPSISRNYRKEAPLFVRSTQQKSFAAPTFTATDLQGNSYNLADLQGKVVVLKFWFINCKPCIMEIPQLNELIADYQNQEVVFLAPTLDKAAAIGPFLSKKPFHYNILPNARPLAHEFSVFSYPTHMVINKEGMVEAVLVGVNTHIRDLLSAAIDKALNGELAVTTPPPSPAPRPKPVQTKEKEVETINTNDIIKNEQGERISFGRFLELANTGKYIAVQRYDDAGQAYILVKSVD